MYIHHTDMVTFFPSNIYLGWKTIFFALGALSPIIVGITPTQHFDANRFAPQ